MTQRNRASRRGHSPLQRIHAERQALLERLAAPGDAWQSGSRPIEAMEIVQDAVAEGVHAVSRQVLMARLKALEQAEDRIRQGTYGICEVCDDAIPARRLEVVPEATLCVSCAEEGEARRILSGRWGGRRRHPWLAAA